MPTVRVNFPPGVTAFTARSASGHNQNPQPVMPDANGQALVDTLLMLSDFLAHGFTVATTPAAGTTAQRPTSGTAAGATFFDVTIGKPVWRNGANNGWIDATGAAV